MTSKEWLVKKLQQNPKYFEEKNARRKLLDTKEKREARSLRKKKWYEKNKIKVFKANNLYVKEKRKNDPLFKLTMNIRNLTNSAFRNKGLKKSDKTFEILGCTPLEFKKYIEQQFDNQMTWDNHGSYWWIDHILPISKGTTVEEIKALNHYTNLRPLEKLENIKKSNKY